MMKFSQEHYLYQQIADQLSREIRQGIYGIGDRMPSLRRLREEHRVSMATVIQAYQQLELQGLVEVRSKSGFFVRERQESLLSEPDLSRPKLSATEVSVGRLAMSLVSENWQPGLIKLGAAVPESSLLPIGILTRTMAGVARRMPLSCSRYERAPGCIELRKAIARLMRESGVLCSVDEIIVTNGCLESLGLCLRALTQRGDSIAIESPTYFGVLQVAESQGLKVIEVATHPNSGIDIESLRTVLQKRRISACVLMPSYNNPLGSCMPEKKKMDLVKLLNKHQVPLIEDDVYGILSYTSSRPKAAMAYDQNGNVLYCSSFSKTISPALRVGWIVTKRYHEQIAYQKFLDNICTSVQPQLALAEILSKGTYRRYMRRAAHIYQQRMKRMRQYISEYFPSGTRVSDPQGGFLVWVEFPPGIDSLELYRRAMHKKIAITPGILFSAQGQYKHHIRLSCGAVDDATAKRSIVLLAKILNDLDK